MIFLGFFNIFFNMYKTISEIQEWVGLSDDQKRHKIFGDMHDFFTFIKRYTEKGDNILIFSQDGKTYFLSLYYLYPRIIASTKDEKEFQRLIYIKRYTYVASYDLPISSESYEMIASFSSQIHPHYGVLYKLK